MNNFQREFNRLKSERGLNNKQIASFTGVKVKDVKQWESGTSFPTDKKIINALEGLLGTEITETLDGFSTMDTKDIGSLLTEESLFSVDKDNVQIKQTRVDKFRNTFQRKETLSKNTEFEFEEMPETKEEKLDEYLTKPVQTTNVLEYSNEEPYIFDEKQIGFYLTRNIKTTALLIILSFIIFNSFGLFWESLNTFLDNLL
jgi:transcriptional regulator with XRE-family HTH domain|tara:strand:+ start:1828 stop:2430 length:603 start_codon:yes stop_codon:yes gene_type:complete